MAAIFPPVEEGGIPPGPNAPGSYVPDNAVVGEGPLYVSSDCTTVLTALQLNSITSEILAAVDKLGFSYNSTRVTNLGDALVAKWGEAAALYVNVSGDQMVGPLLLARDPQDPMEAATKNYSVARTGDHMLGILTLSGDPLQPLDAAPKQFVDAQVTQLRNDTNNALDIMQGDVNRRVLRTGDTMNGELDLWTGVDATNPDAAMRKDYIDKQDQKRLLLSGGVMTGTLTLAGDPLGPMDAATREFVLANAQSGPEGGYVPTTGGTMTGLLILSGPPTAALGAATKAYVDNTLTGAASVSYVDTQIATRVAKSGDTMSGPLLLNADPVQPMAASTKSYTDSVGAAARSYADTAAANAANTAANNRVLRSGDTMSGDLTISKGTPTISFFGADASAGRTLHYRYNGLMTWQIAQADVINYHAYNDSGSYVGSALNVYRPNTQTVTIETQGISATSGEGSGSQYSGAIRVTGGIGVGGGSFFNSRSTFNDGLYISTTYPVYRDNSNGVMVFYAQQQTFCGYQFWVYPSGSGPIPAFQISGGGTLTAWTLRNGSIYADSNGNFYIGSIYRGGLLGSSAHGVDALRPIQRGDSEDDDNSAVIAMLVNAVIELADKVEALQKVANG